MKRLLLLVSLVCAACTQPGSAQTATPPPTPDPSALLAQAQQADAPALTASGSDLVAAWVGLDERGVHQDARLIRRDELSAPLTLPLPPTRPYAQRLVPGAEGKTHLLWLDADATGQTALYGALLTGELTVERGPVPLSEGLALAFSAVPDGAGGIWTAWSGGRVAEMSIFTRRSDEQARPLETTAVAVGEHPALIRSAGGEIWLFWLADGILQRRRIDPAGETAALTGTISLAAGDQLVNVRAAPDGNEGAYFFWNVTRSSGMSETWWTWGRLDASAWRQPARLRDDSGNALRWTEPAIEAGELTALAAANDAGLGIVLLSGGEVVGYKLAAPGVELIGIPALVRAADGYVLAWSALGAPSADLRLLRVPG